EPVLSKRYHCQAKYQEFKGEPFIKGPHDKDPVNPYDVQQKDLGDCYIFGAMAAVARANPGVIEKLIKENNDGTYTVTLYIQEGSLEPSKTPREIIVRPTFPVQRQGRPVYGGFGNVKKEEGGGTKPELWAMLIEKAYAINAGGYNKLE